MLKQQPAPSCPAPTCRLETIVPVTGSISSRRSPDEAQSEPAPLATAYALAVRSRERGIAECTPPDRASIGTRLLSNPVTTQARLFDSTRSEEHTSELQSHVNIVCRLL